MDILKRKVFTDVLGNNYSLNENQTKEFKSFLSSKYGKNNNSYLRVRYFILYDLNDYIGRYEQCIKDGRSITIESLKNKYGNIEGMCRWEKYKTNQSLSNKFDSKKKKYGWSEEQFNDYNNSRAITVKNMIKKYGEEDGIKKYNNYIEKQKYSNTLGYFKEKYGNSGELKFLEYNHSKGSSRRLLDIMEKNNVTFEEGIKILQERMISSSVSNTEKIFSDMLFSKIGYDFKYSYKTKQYCRWCYEINGPVFYDIVDTDLRIAIEYNGDLWHANPQNYNDNDIVPVINKKAKEIWQYDSHKRNCLTNDGFIYIVVWESDFIKNANKILEDIEWEINKHKE